MEAAVELSKLKQFADMAACAMVGSQADLNPKDHVHPEMLDWCSHHQNIAVLQNGNILSAEPWSRLTQTCKVVMQNKALTPGTVIPATQDVIKILLANARDIRLTQTPPVIANVSEQQQRLRMLVKEALAAQASDIHFEIRNEITRIRFRKHGELFLHTEWTPRLGREVVAVAFNKETDQSSTHFNPQLPQNASMPLMINDQEVRLRLASLPAHSGFDVVMRILTTANSRAPSLSNLGYTPTQIALIQQASNMPHGAVIVSGPTGSGKTTTLASCMQLINNDRKVFTIEDPVEKIIENATQVPVNTEHYDRSFATMARTVLRMDPDVIVLGEMRDEDTAAIMARAAITGHLVFSTLHTNSAPDIITRLSDLGISNSLLASPNLLVCLICQRLAPLLCEHCKIPLSQSVVHRPYLSRWRELFNTDFYKLYARGNQCSACHHLGINGRTVVAEIIWLDDPSRQFIQRHDILGWQKYLRNQGWQNYGAQLLDLVRDGRVDPLDAEKLAGQLTYLAGTTDYSYRKTA